MNTYEKFYRDLEGLCGTNLKYFVSRGGYTRRTNDPYMKLTLEWIGNCCVALAHWGEQNGDLMRDPEVVFDINFKNMTAEPIAFRNDYIAVTREVYAYDDQGERVGVNLRERADLAAFCRAWFRNIKDQGFCDDKAIATTKFAYSEDEIGALRESR